MFLKDNYTELARKYALSHPLLNFVGKQITFWFFANLLLGIVLYLQSLVISEAYGLPQVTRFFSTLVVAVIFGFLHGTILGLCDYYLDKSFFQKQSLGKTILIKVGISFIVLVILVMMLKYFIMPSLFGSFFSISLQQKNKVWHLVFIMLAVYYFSMSLLISFINQVNKKYGPGVLVPLLLGKYRMPREEVRVLMFMDLNASTSIAEKLGHIRYSEFIRDSFMDINFVVTSYTGAEIYQYVGDEIVLTWLFRESENNHLACIDFFFACHNRFQERKEFYFEQYQVVPSFKAGVHVGKVTAVEIGDIKREIAYHGDTMNTAARILGLCNDYQKKILVSDRILPHLHNDHQYAIEGLGKIKLRGKMQEVEIASVQPLSNAISGIN